MSLEDLLFGTALIRILQDLLAPQFTRLFEAVTMLGSDYFLAGVAAVVYWCYDKRRGRLLTYVLLLGTYVNFFLKLLVPSPRPPLELRLAENQETSFGFPSGHVQNSTTLWTSLALLFRKRIHEAIGAVLIFAVGLSRMYLGLHTPVQAIGGVVVGLVFVLAIFLILKRIPCQDGNIRVGTHLAFAALTTLPWVAAISLFGVMGDGGRVAGYLLGFTIGAIFEDRFIHLEMNITHRRRLIRLVIGGVIGLIALGVISVAVRETDLLSVLAGNALLGLTIVLIIPAALHVMERERHSREHL